MLLFKSIRSRHLFVWRAENMANKATSEKNKPARKKLRDNEYYNPKSKRYEYHYRESARIGWKQQISYQKGGAEERVCEKKKPN